jgi:hypothetical protein
MLKKVREMAVDSGDDIRLPGDGHLRFLFFRTIR